MKGNDLLAQLSLVSLVLVSMHIADDFVQGFDKHPVDNPYGIIALVVWASGFLLLRDRFLGRIILLLGGLIAVAMPIMHLNGHIAPTFAAANGALRFIWTLYLVGTTGALTVMLALGELFRRRVEREGA